MQIKFSIYSLGRFLKRKYFHWKYSLKNVHPTFYIGGKTSISSDFIAGPYSYVGPNCIIYPKVSIGAYTMIANNVSILGGDHNFKKAGTPTIFSGREELKPTIIGKDVWIGSNSIVMTGLTIGDGTIVAAGSVVTKSLEPFSIYGGVPARKIKERFDNMQDLMMHKMLFHTDPADFKYDATLLCKGEVK